MTFFTKEETKALVIIFLVLIIISVPNFILSLERARDLTRKDDLFHISNLLNAYQKEIEEYPMTLPDKILDSHVPQDPQTANGLKYVYASNGKRFQIFASLEDKSQDEYSKNIEARGISCGARICNLGRASGTTPLDKTIEEYENELYEKK